LHWNSASGEFDSDAVADIDAVVNLLRAMGLRNATVTGAARDDLSDGGAWLYATTVRAVKELKPVDRRPTIDPRLQRRALPACRGLRVAPRSVGAQRRNG
jgi:lipoate synthase